MPKEAIEAIDSVNWRAAILAMKGEYNDEQIDALETETELLLCKILNTKDYPKELEKRMKISTAEVQILINRLYSLVFSKMQDNLIKILDTGKVGKEGEDSSVVKDGLKEFSLNFGKGGLLGMALYSKDKRPQTELRNSNVDIKAQAKKELELFKKEQELFVKKYNDPIKTKEKIDSEIKDTQAELSSLRVNLKSTTDPVQKEKLARREVELSAGLFNHFTTQKELEYVLSLPEKIENKKREAGEV